MIMRFFLLQGLYWSSLTVDSQTRWFSTNLCRHQQATPPSRRSNNQQIRSPDQRRTKLLPFLSSVGQLVRGAIAKAGGSTATSIDGVSYPHLKHLGPRALDTLTVLYNRSASGNCIPARWKVASVSPTTRSRTNREPRHDFPGLTVRKSLPKPRLG